MSINTISPAEIFLKGIELHHYANTAYPLDHNNVWREFKQPNEKLEKIIQEEWGPVQELGLYVHIPFCKNRCSYCEYTVVSGEDRGKDSEYEELLIKEIKKYNRFMTGKTAVGLDIGGGTPSIFSPDSIQRIMEALLPSYNHAPDFEISIETTPIIALELDRIKKLHDIGIERISMGLQTIDPKILAHVGRIDNTTTILSRATNNIREAGFTKFNVDLMYGFKGENLESFRSTVEFAISLGPEFITLYRNRYKGTKLEADAKQVSLVHANLMYNTAFTLLNGAGYSANDGKNTFSKVADNPGTSRYLTKRVIDGTPYLGLGLGAQNMAKSSMYYNHGAASKRLKEYQQNIENNLFPIQDFYLLPKDEMMAKMICVSFYFGQIDLGAFKKRFEISLEEAFKEEIEFATTKGLMEYTDTHLKLTSEGKNAINGVIPLFYSERSKANLLSKQV